MDNKFFLTQIKRTNGTYEKGVVVKDDENAARQSFHAYLGAYGYGHDAATDYVSVSIQNMAGAVILSTVDNRIAEDEEEATNE
jgi:hypothetical protein